MVNLVYARLQVRVRVEIRVKCFVITGGQFSLEVRVWLGLGLRPGLLVGSVIQRAADEDVVVQ